MGPENANGAAPFLRWAGSKRRLLPKLRTYWSSRNKRYFEPFMGSACLFFELTPKAAVLSDINADLIEAYRAVKTKVHRVYDALSSIKVNEETYYKIRAREPHNLDYIERVARFIYLNRFCFNGIYRTNNQGKYNVPYGGQKSGAIPSKNHFLECANRLKCAQIVHGDFEAIIRENVRKGDFFYLDPPYALANRRIHTQYDAHSFGTADIDRLTQALDLIVSRGASFVLSYADCKEAREIASAWSTKIVLTQRNVAGFSDNRSTARELIISSQ